MKLYRYSKIDHFTLSYKLMKELEDHGEKINSRQREIIEDYIRYRYTVLQWDKLEKTSPILRLTAPIYIVVIFVLFLFRPVKYIFTGDSYYHTRKKKKLYDFLKKWEKAIGIYIVSYPTPKGEGLLASTMEHALT